MSSNTDLIEYKIQNYAKDLIAIHVQREFDIQILDWKDYILDAATAFITAFENHEKVLETVNKKRQADFELAMLVFSIVGGVAFSWVGATIQYNLAPKLLNIAGSKKLVKLALGSKSGVDVSKVKAKMFGDIVSTGLEMGTDYAANENKKSAIAEEKPLLNLTKDSFTTTLEKEIIKEKRRVFKEIGKLSLSIQNSEDFGKKIISRPSVKSKKGNDLKYNEAIKEVVDTLWEVRKKWAEDWFYFGNNPFFIDTKHLAKEIEIELWAFWLLEQDIKIITEAKTIKGNPAANRVDWRFDHRIPASVKYKSPNSLILDRLAELAVIPPRTLVRSIGNPKTGKFPEISVPGIEGGIDTKKEYEDIIKWAESHREISLVRGNIVGLTRNIPRNIEDVYK